MAGFDRASDVIVLNTFSGGDVKFVERRGTLASGARRKARYLLELKSEPLLFDLSELNLGQAVAETWAQRIRDQIVGISERAAPATLRFRERAARALSGAGGAAGPTKGQRADYWKRYAGGRMGYLPPNQSDKLFSDSGRLAMGITVRANLTDASYSVNAPVSRLNPTTFGPRFREMLDRFIAHVPILDPKKALGDPAIEKAIKQGVDGMIAKAESDSEASILRALARRRAAVKQLAKTLLGVARGVFGD